MSFESVCRVKPIISFSKVTSNFPPKLEMAASSYFLLLFLVPLKNKFVNILALPDEDNDSYLEPPLKKIETELP